jgi:hypothetical protein
VESEANRTRSSYENQFRGGGFTINSPKILELFSIGHADILSSIELEIYENLFGFSESSKVRTADARVDKNGCRFATLTYREAGKIMNLTTLFFIALVFVGSVFVAAIPQDLPSSTSVSETGDPSWVFIRLLLSSTTFLTQTCYSVSQIVFYPPNQYKFQAQLQLL